MVYYILQIWLLLLAASCGTGAQPSASPQTIPTALEHFHRGIDEMPSNLTFLSYLYFDELEDFKNYTIAYGLTEEKKERLIHYLHDFTETYQQQGWTLEFLLIGKGLSAQSQSPGGILAVRYSPLITAGGTYEVKIAFRGSMTPADWGTNLSLAKKPLRFSDDKIPPSIYETIYKDGGVHGGFLQSYNTIAPFISNYIASLRQKNPNARFFIRIGGHSLGAALATLCAAHLTIQPDVGFLEGQNMIQLETYGSPRVMGIQLSQELEQKLGKDNIVRFVNQDAFQTVDRVTNIPFEAFVQTFRHVGDRCTLQAAGEDIYEGFPRLRLLRIPHRMEGYLAAYREQRDCLQSP